MVLIITECHVSGQGGAEANGGWVHFCRTTLQRLSDRLPLCCKLSDRVSLSPSCPQAALVSANWCPARRPQVTGFESAALASSWMLLPGNKRMQEEHQAFMPSSIRLQAICQLIPVQTQYLPAKPPPSAQTCPQWSPCHSTARNR